MKIRKWFSENVSFGKKHLRVTQQQLTDVISRESNILIGQQSFNYLWDKTLHCKELGVSRERLCNEEVVVSLTSYGERIHEVHLAIESIMQQTVKPNRIILWLSEDEFKGKTLPVALQIQQERGLEIAYCEDLKSYTKLMPALKRFPEACIITIDDDVAYQPDVVEKLINSHIDNPNNICAFKYREIILGKNNKPIPYRDWPYCVEKCPDNKKLAFFLGVGGVLYPPHCFTDEIFNKDVYLNLGDTTDDVWFNAMRLLSGAMVTKVFPANSYIDLPSSRVNPLWIDNIYSGINDHSISAIYVHYGLFDVLNNG